jgi:L-ascorbate metabolism protein UlaG (beta-lactamase superfamily)
MMDNLVLIHCGDLGHKLTTEQIEEVGNPDILFIPIGGYFTIDSHIASELVMMLEPKIVIPMHYLRKGMNQEQFGQISPVAAFLKEMGKERVIPQPKLTISKDKLPQETEIVLLE